MSEFDLILMSVVIFLPTAFALVLAFFPRGSDEWMKWFSLLGTAATLVASVILFIEFYNGPMTFNLGQSREHSSLLYRAEGDRIAHESVTAPPFNDLVGRQPWIERFH